MAVKKLLIKKNKAGKLKIHKKGISDAEVNEPAKEEEVSEAPEVEEAEIETEQETETVGADSSGGDDGDEGLEGTVSIGGEVIGTATKIKIKHGKPVVGKTEVEHLENGEHVSSEFGEEEVAEVGLKQHMANVGFSLSRSINLGNYESLKCSVSINVPSEVDVDEIEENYEFAKGWCEEKMNELTEEYIDDEES